MRNPKPPDGGDDQAKHEREQIKKIYSVMRVELEQLTVRADAAIERLRAKAAKTSAPLRLVKSR